MLSGSRAGLVACCAAGVLALAGCAPSVPGEQPDAAAPTRDAGTSTPAPYDPSALLAGVAEAAAPLGGRIAVVVRDAAGEHVLAGPGADDVVHTASLVKVLVVVRLLALDRSGALDLRARDREAVERAIVASDDAAMNALWERYDGARLVADAAADAGLSRTAPPVERGQWGRTTTTARDVAAFLAALPELLHEDDARTLLGWMRAASGTAADGFDQRFGLLADEGRDVAAKQGWMCCVDRRRLLHSAGVLPGGLVVVLLGDFPASVPYARVRTALDAAATDVLVRKG